MSNRLFLAVPLPRETKEAVARWTESLKARHDGWRWVSPDNLHLTLRFYGETAEEIESRLVERLRELESKEAAFDLEVCGWGTFPSPSRPRILWIGVTGELAPLERLARAAEEDAVALGFEPERRRFHPHLTVARAGRGRGRPSLPPRNRDGEPRFGDLPVDRIVLYRSQLGPGGPKYEPALEVPLRGARTTGGG
jgi:2'-5' RNA ligase